MNPPFYLLSVFFVLLAFFQVRYIPVPSSDVGVKFLTRSTSSEAAEIFDLDPNARKLDNFQLVHMWIPTFCEINKIVHPCKDGLPKDFTMHGVWPADSKGQPIKGSNQDDISAEINQVREDLEEAWPNVRSDQAEDNFWTHQWNKHGCMSQMETLNYLKAAINEAKNIKPAAQEETNLLVFLANENIVPSDTNKYSWDEIEQAILKGIGLSKGRIYLRCHKIEDEYMLSEIKICLQKTNMNYIACPARTIVSCGQKKKDKNIKIPLFNP